MLLFFLAHRLLAVPLLRREHAAAAMTVLSVAVLLLVFPLAFPLTLVARLLLFALSLPVFYILAWYAVLAKSEKTAITTMLKWRFT